MDKHTCKYFHSIKRKKNKLKKKERKSSSSFSFLLLLFLLLLLLILLLLLLFIYLHKFNSKFCFINFWEFCDCFFINFLLKVDQVLYIFYFYIFYFSNIKLFFKINFLRFHYLIEIYSNIFNYIGKKFRNSY